MSFTTFTNVITILFCLAVLVQSVRMMRSLKQMREGQLDQTVLAVNNATAQARSVLSGLRETLSTDGVANFRALGDAREIREELNVMIGIANAMAERLMDAASLKTQGDEAALIAKTAKPTKKAQLARPPKSRRQPASAAATVSTKKPAKTTAAKRAGSRSLRAVETGSIENSLPELADQAQEAA